MEVILDHDESENRNYNYAGFWIRFVAALIDGIAVFVIVSIIKLLFGMDILDRDWYSSGQLISTVIGVIYYAYFESSEKQATPGKMALGIKVIGEDGGRISFMNALGRYFAKILSAVILCIGYIMAAFDKRKQALHDKLAKTYVVIDNSNEAI